MSAESRRTSGKLNSIYERCVRHALRDYRAPLKQLQDRLDIPSLDERWHLSLFRLMKSIQKTMMQAKHRSVADFIDIFQNDPGYAPIVFLQLFDESPMGSRRSIFKQPKCSTKTSGQNSIRYYGTSFWNKIPEDARLESHKSQKALQAIRKHLQQLSGVSTT